MKELTLKRNERLVRVVRRYTLTHLPQFFAVVASFSVGFFFMFWLFRHGWWGQAIFVLLSGTGVFFFLRILFAHYGNVCYLTTQRVIDIDRRGLFQRVISEIPYDQIEDVSGHILGFFGTIFRYGQVEIQSGRGKILVIIDSVKHPRRVQQHINILREEYIRGAKNFITASRIVRWVENEADEEELRDIEGALERRLRDA